MSVFPNGVDSVAKPPTLLLLLPEDRTAWCDQFSHEGYNVVHVAYPANNHLVEHLNAAEMEILAFGAEWALLTYGLLSKDAKTLSTLFAASLPDLKACVHFCPGSETGLEFIFKNTEGKHVPTIFHLASTQETLHASILPLADPATFDYHLPTSSFSPVVVYNYPLVPFSPPFPFLTIAPTQATAGQTSPVDPYLRSATNLSLTRTLELLKRHLGPHFDLEKLWEKHTYYEFVERNAAKTMSTMVTSPYVNHVPTMTGGVGFDDLSRFYKYHFTGVTPPDSEMITVSRTVGADRIIDEMIFKCTHTCEIDYLLPGIPPTGKPLEIALVGIVGFRGDKLFFEYWDQASVLVQLGLLETLHLPVAGVEAARKVMDPFALPSNTLLAKWKSSGGLSTNVD